MTVLSTILIFSFVYPAVGTSLSGTKCNKVKITKFMGNKEFKCIRSGNKLVWNKGVVTKASLKFAAEAAAAREAEQKAAVEADVKAAVEAAAREAEQKAAREAAVKAAAEESLRQRLKVSFSGNFYSWKFSRGDDGYIKVSLEIIFSSASFSDLDIQCIEIVNVPQKYFQCKSLGGDKYSLLIEGMEQNTSYFFDFAWKLKNGFIGATSWKAFLTPVPASPNTPSKPMVFP